LSEKKKKPYAMSRRRRTAVVAVFLLLGAAFVGLEHSSIRRKWQLRPKSEEQVKARDFVKYHAKNFTVANV